MVGGVGGCGLGKGACFLCSSCWNFTAICLAVAELCFVCVCVCVCVCACECIVCVWGWGGVGG